MNNLIKIHNLLLIIFGFALICACNGSRQGNNHSELTLKETFGKKFLVGAAVNNLQATEQDTNAVKILRTHFNSIVSENDMKMESVHPEEGRFDFEKADALVHFGEKYDMNIIGHCLIWHSQCPEWFCVDDKGKNVSAEVLKRRMKEHITTVVSRYKGKIKGWDVVNEAILDDGSYRQSSFYQILGEEFIPLAFKYAHEADPNVELYLNDYNMHEAGKRNAYVKIINNLKTNGLRIDAIGMQSHIGMDYPDLDEFEKSMVAYAGTGIKVMITEWDMSALPTVNCTSNISDTIAFTKAMNPYPEMLPDSVSKRWNKRMKKFFNLFLKHADIVDRVTAWGVSDHESWKNDFPVHGRHDYPLLFDRNYQMKPFLKELLQEHQ